ncbi:MAG: tRNA-5-methyluridine54 2-sulfurtransferase [Clostridia bacterium]|nr:tRNA-5-methyluridine54 2-sulfurtransferase [Clostridia bacterium]
MAGNFRWVKRGDYPMRCLKCGQKACLEIRRHHAAFCPEHLLEHLHKQVARAIKAYRMFTKEEKLLVAVSGGKDSLALWDILLSMGYQAHGLYIDLGIPGYSETSRQKARNFASAKKAVLHEISLREIYGVDVGYIARKNAKTFCSACGLVKRYIMNLAAASGGYDAIATGHNLDDEAAALLGNLLYWQTGYLRRQSPHMPAGQGLARKVKPLCRLGERETSAYCLLQGIDYVLEECPMSRGTHTLLYKELLNKLEASAPGTKDQFYLGFLRTGRSFFHNRIEEPILKPCTKCGQPTTDEVCGFCRQMSRAGLDPLALRAAIVDSVGSGV